jgi:hypothetical protein
LVDRHWRRNADARIAYTAALMAPAIHRESPFPEMRN